MSPRNKRMLELRRRSLRLRRAPRRDRRGVLLMVVLSMLALFLLLGTAFLVSSQFYWTSGKEASKLNRTTNNPADLLERAHAASAPRHQQPKLSHPLPQLVARRVWERWV